ncbi:MAG: GTPase domain-containing protein [Gemmataceae bacterium]
METSDLRNTIRTLATDFGWLEDHCRNHPEQAIHTTHLRLAAALVRNVIGPAVDSFPSQPLHVAVVGGAGAGKSTVVNFLAGRVVAEANPQAGYTRHPTAFVPESLSSKWPSSDGFLGSMVRIDGDAPANRDEDVYQRKTISLPGTDPLAEFVIWDCPDMTTVAAGGYASRLTEVAALADVIVYVASDERYNDEIPTQYLHLLIRAGKAVVVCLTKMKEADTAGLSEHFRNEVLGKLPAFPDGSRPNVPVVCIPSLSAAERADGNTYSGKYRVALANPLLALCSQAEVTRARTVANASRFLETAAEGLLDIARADLSHVNAWKANVTSGREGFEDRYRREFLVGETFRRFDRSRDEILDLLELPGKAKSISTILGFVRWPYVKAQDFLVSMVSRPPALSLSERDVLTNALSGWLDGLQAESIRHASMHPVWKQAATAFGSGAKQTANDKFTIALRDYETKEMLEIESAGKGMTDHLQANPVLVNGLRGIKITAEVAVVIFTIWYFWQWNWWIILLVPLSLALVHQIAEWCVRLLVETARARVRGQRMALVSAQLTTPLAVWLAELPMTEGTSIERLNQILARVPDAIQRVTGSMKRGPRA